MEEDFKLEKIYNENCLDTMRRMPDGFVDLVVTSPPYDGLRKYNGYSFDFNAVADGLWRTVKDGGVVVWVCSDATMNGGETLTSFKQALHFKEIGFNVYDTMIWLKPSPQAPTEGRYYNVFEYMFVLSKGAPAHMHLLKDRANKSAGQVSRRETRSCREDRKVTDRKRVVAETSRRFNVWEISRGHNETSHPAVFPEELVRGHILSWSDEGDIVYDPFMGSGTTAKVAHLLGRKWIGSEISEDYVKMAEERR